MAKLVEIGGLIKKGLGHGVTERFSKNKDVISVGYANGRASDIFDEQQFGSASEAEILTLIVKDNKSNAIFDELYKHLKLDKEKKREIIESYFGKNGNKYSMARTHINSCDFSLGNYAHVEDENDLELKTFSLKRNKISLIPMINDALKKRNDKFELD